MISIVQAGSELEHPYECPRSTAPANKIDALVVAQLQDKSIAPARLCSDEVFIRRVCLDINGVLPTPGQVEHFLNDQRQNKRALLIDGLLTREQFADYWSLKWCDLLRVKAEYPINLWPNGVQAYHRWIHDALNSNMPYDQFVRALLTSSGSNFRVPPVNFYRAIQGEEPSSIARAVGLTFMGTRIDKWPEEQRQGMEAFFSRVAYKKTAEWKEQIVFLDPVPTEPLTATFPDGQAVEIPAGQDPREVFADWLIKANNPWFTRSIVNRVWYWLMGYGIIHEPDDIRDDNLPINPQLLAYLEKEFVGSRYDLRHLYRIILNSQTYQQSSILRSNHPEAERYFACYPVRQLDAEVLVDALCSISGTTEAYSSPIPEPFTFVPEEHRSIELSDGSITSQFLEMFGRPSRDTGLESERTSQSTDKQRLHMLNSTHIQEKIEKGPKLQQLSRSVKWNKDKMVEGIYLSVLSRYPTAEEQKVALAYYKTEGMNVRQATNDIAWALINSKEFMFRH